MLTSTEMLQQLRWRYAVKKFDATKKIPAETWAALQESLVLTPSSFGLQPWKFVVITDQSLKDQLPEHSWNQTQVRDASHVVVLARKQQLNEADIQQYLDCIVQVRGGSVAALDGYKSMMVGALVKSGMNLDHWAGLQVYIALGQFMGLAAMLGVDTCPMEGIIPAKYDELLGLPAQGYATSVVVTAGYRAADDKYADIPKVRFPASQVVEVR
jgi:nitroreductase